MLGTWEPVRVHLITSLAKPEGNVTGVAWFGLPSKHVELLKEIVPNMRRVAYIVAPTPSHLDVTKLSELFGDEESAASTLGFTWQLFRPVVGNDYDEIFARLATEHFDAAYIPGTPENIHSAPRIFQLSLRYLIPTVAEDKWWARNGLLLAYGQDIPWGLARGAEYVNKILRGARPSDLPVEQATKVQLVINLKTAMTLGLAVPSSLIALADEVIE